MDGTNLNNQSRDTGNIGDKTLNQKTQNRKLQNVSKTDTKGMNLEFYEG
jgi:hypothetical protein